MQNAHLNHHAKALAMNLQQLVQVQHGKHQFQKQQKQQHLIHLDVSFNSISLDDMITILEALLVPPSTTCSETSSACKIQYLNIMGNNLNSNVESTTSITTTTLFKLLTRHFIALREAHLFNQYTSLEGLDEFVMARKSTLKALSIANCFPLPENFIENISEAKQELQLEKLNMFVSENQDCYTFISSMAGSLKSLTLQADDNFDKHQLFNTLRSLSHLEYIDMSEFEYIVPYTVDTILEILATLKHLKLVKIREYHPSNSTSACKHLVLLKDVLEHWEFESIDNSLLTYLTNYEQLFEKMDKLKTVKLGVSDHALQSFKTKHSKVLARALVVGARLQIGSSEEVIIGTRPRAKE